MGPVRVQGLNESEQPPNSMSGHLQVQVTKRTGYRTPLLTDEAWIEVALLLRILLGVACPQGAVRL